MAPAISYPIARPISRTVSGAFLGGGNIPAPPAGFGWVGYTDPTTGQFRLEVYTDPNSGDVRPVMELLAQ